MDWIHNYEFNSQKNKRRGPNHPNFGKVFSKVSRKKMSISHSAEKSHCAKLNWKKVKEIRKMYSTKKFSFEDLASKFDVKRTTIGNIVNNQSWIDNQYVPVKKNKNEVKMKKLSAHDVRAIRILLETKSATSIAKIYNVSKTTVLAIKNNRIWKNLT
jgi:DNA-binding XRE family transcriptional regulator